MTPGESWQLVPVPAGRLYEGMRWLRHEKVFQWVDILDPALFRWGGPGAREVERRPLDLDFATVALDLEDGRQLVASRDELHAYDWQTGVMERLHALELKDSLRFNDGGTSPHGTHYVGTMSMAGDAAAGALYRVAEALVPVLSDVGISNGLGWTGPDEAMHVDSRAGTVSRLTFDPDGDVLDRTVLTRFSEPEEPDGLVVAPDGSILLALWGGRRVVRLGPDGQWLEDMPVPAAFPTSVAVGGDAGDVVVVTTAGHQESGVPPGGRDGHVLWRHAARP